MIQLFNKIIRYNEYINTSPLSYPLVKFKYPKSDISDLFIFRLGEYETIFIAENNLALLTSELIECEHLFYFFDDVGNSCGNFSTTSNDFHFNLEIDTELTHGVQFGSFIHQIVYANNVIKTYKETLKGITFHHRGYTGYKLRKSNGFSYVHGNFGGMFLDSKKNLKSLARLRDKHTYTPQFTIKPKHDYEFIFSNPTSKCTFIKFFLTDNSVPDMIQKEDIGPYSTFNFCLKNLNIDGECNISWETNLPIGRCTVFETFGRHMDVFHS